MCWQMCHFQHPSGKRIRSSLCTCRCTTMVMALSVWSILLILHFCTYIGSKHWNCPDSLPSIILIYYADFIMLVGPSDTLYGKGDMAMGMRSWWHWSYHVLAQFKTLLWSRHSGKMSILYQGRGYRFNQCIVCLNCHSAWVQESKCKNNKDSSLFLWVTHLMFYEARGRRCRGGKPQRLKHETVHFQQQLLADSFELHGQD